MRKPQLIEPSSMPCSSIVHEFNEAPSFGRVKIDVLVLLAGIVLFNWSIGWSAASIIHVVQFQSSVSANDLPQGWSLQKYKGTPAFRINQDDRYPHLQVMSKGESAFGFRKEMNVDIQTYPYLYWSWKAVKLPDGGDVRNKDTDDQCIQIYLVLQVPGDRKLFSTPSSLAYIWDNSAPKDILVRSPQAMLGNVRYFVLRNGRDKLGVWSAERRNVLRDVNRAFGGHLTNGGPVIVKGVLLFINTHHTRSDAEGCIGNIYFSDQ